jgi:hypothetical protein
MPTVLCYPSLSLAKQLCDLAGIVDDIYQAIDYIAEIERQAGTNSQNSPSWQAVTTAATIAYARCFAEGVRQRLPHSFFSAASPEIKEFHEYLIDLRNKHIAHSVSLYEENRLSLRISQNEKGIEFVESIKIESRKVIGIGVPDIPRFRELCEWLLYRVLAEQQKEEMRVMKQIREIPITQLLKEQVEPLPAFFVQNAHKKARQQK